jgi:enamine deaminase RidA (YjgF/YER057c/UK114 family)
MVFAACRALPRHVENPLQVPAYNYPDDYGPRAPSFARATIAPDGGGHTVFISGTAAIRGHATIAPHRTGEQLACTLENLREISRACGLGPELGVGRAARRHFKIYLRDADDQPAVAAVLEKQLLRTGDSFSYLLANICREPLMVEIEATLWRVAGV